MLIGMLLLLLLIASAENLIPKVDFKCLHSNNRLLLLNIYLALAVAIAYHYDCDVTYESNLFWRQFLCMMISY